MHADLKRKKKQQFKCIIILPRPIRWYIIETKMSVYSGLFKLKKMCFTLKIPSRKVMAPVRFFRYLLKLGNSLLFWAFCIFYVHHLLRPEPCVRSAGTGSRVPGSRQAGLVVICMLVPQIHQTGWEAWFLQVQWSLKERCGMCQLLVVLLSMKSRAGGPPMKCPASFSHPPAFCPWENKEKSECRVSNNGGNKHAIWHLLRTLSLHSHPAHLTGGKLRQRP